MAKIKIDDRGTKAYLNDADAYHREDGPSIIFKNGAKFYYVNGMLSSDTRPSQITPTGNMLWLIRNKLSRFDGPASDYPNGYKYWFDTGKMIWPRP